jgi:hypothetical protein
MTRDVISTVAKARTARAIQQGHFEFKRSATQSWAPEYVPA